VLALLGVAVALGFGGRASAADETTSSQVDGAHTGAVAGDTMTPPLALLWSKQLGDFVGEPIVAGGRVFVAAGHDGSSGAVVYAGDQTVFAFDENTGDVAWSLRQNAQLLTYDSGRLFGGVYGPETDDGTIEGVAADTGRILWSRSLARTLVEQVIADGGTLFVLLNDVNTNSDRVVAVDESTGRTLWTTAVENNGVKIAVDATAVYATAGCEAYAYSRVNGAKLWVDASAAQYACGNLGLLPAVYRGRVYSRHPSNVSATAGNTVFDATTGKIVGHGFRSATAPAFSGGRGFFDGGDALRAVELGSGATAWTLPGSTATLGYWAAPPVVDNGSVYDLRADGTLWAAATSTGAVQWQTQALAADAVASQGVEANPSMAIGQGLLVVGATSGQVGTAELEVYGDAGRQPVALAQGFSATPVSGPRCVVPRLAGVSLSVARGRLRRGHCTLGRLDRPARVRRGEHLVVSASSPRAGLREPPGTRVDLRLRAHR
jgi:outer membrane protein assembly factor BamB